MCTTQKLDGFGLKQNQQRGHKVGWIGKGSFDVGGVWGLDEYGENT